MRQRGSGASPPATGLSAQAQADRALFFDRSLSASGVQSCGTCHVPARAFTADPATDHDLPAGGNQPTLTAAEIDDVVAFLCTLTDGFDPGNPSAYNVPAQCAPQAP